MHATYTGAYHIHLYTPYAHIHTTNAYTIHVHMPYIQIHGTRTCIYHVHLHIYPLITLPEHLLPCTHAHLASPRSPTQLLGALFFLSHPGPQEICWDSAAHSQWRIDTSGLHSQQPSLLPCQQLPCLVQDGIAKLSGKVAQLQRKLQKLRSHSPSRPNSSWIIIKSLLSLCYSPEGNSRNTHTHNFSLNQAIIAIQRKKIKEYL